MTILQGEMYKIYNRKGAGNHLAGLILESGTTAAGDDFTMALDGALLFYVVDIHFLQVDSLSFLFAYSSFLTECVSFLDGLHFLLLLRFSFVVDLLFFAEF